MTLKSTSTLTSLLLAFGIGFVPPVYASEIDQSDLVAVKRPKIGLVLSGGGARGSAHVGILKVLEQNHIPIDYIAGTSMGSVIGALYASGMSADEISAALSEIDWDDAFNDAGPRTDDSSRDRADDHLYLVNQQIGIKDGAMQLPTALIQGQRFELLLRKLTIQTSKIRDFDKLPIPFRAIATDIATGEEVVLSKGDLSVAIRASMAVPGAFDAVKINGRLLSDGGLVNNLPVNVVRDMGADIIIAIDISTPLHKQGELSNAFLFAEQVTGLLTRRETEKQILNLSDRDILIIPELGNLTSSDFDRYDEAISAGIKAATKQLDQLKPLTMSPTDYAKHMSAHNTDYFQLPVIDFIRINDDSIINDEVLRDRLGIKPGDLLDTDSIDRGINEIYTLGNYSHVSYSIIEENGKTGLEINTKEKPWGTSGVEFGLDLFTNLDGTSTTNLAVAYTQKPMNTLNGEWRTILQIGEDPEFVTEWYQPLDSREIYFINPILSSTRDSFNNFVGNDVASRHRIRLNEAALWLGRNFADQAMRLRIGISRGTGSVDLLTGDPTDPRLNIDDFETGNIAAELLYDSLNSVTFPSSGSFVEMGYVASRESIGADQNFDFASIRVLKAYPVETGSILLSAKFNTIVEDNGSGIQLVQTGGFLNLSGLQRDQLSGQHSGLLVSTYLHKLTASHFLSSYAGASLELGNAWGNTSDINLSNSLTAGSLFLGSETPIGPVYFAIGLAEGGNKSLYLFIGTPRF